MLAAFLALGLIASVAFAWPLPGKGAAWAASGPGRDGIPDDDIEDRIEDDVEDAVEAALEDDVEDRIEGDVEDAVEDDIAGKLEDRIEDTIADRTEDRSGKRLDDRLDSRLEDDLEKAAEVRADAERRLEKQLEDAAEEAERAAEDAAEEAERAAEDAAEEAAKAAEDAAEEAERAAEDAVEEAERAAEDAAKEGRDEDRHGHGGGADDEDDRRRRGDDDDRQGHMHRDFDLGVDKAGQLIRRGEWVVLAPKSEIDELVSHGFTVKERAVLAKLGLALARLAAPEGSDRDAAEAVIQAAAPNATVDYNHLYFRDGDSAAALPDAPADAPPDTVVGWAPRAAVAWPRPLERRAPRLGMIDTAIDGAHPSLAGAHLEIRDFVDTTAARPTEHGTAIASILVGQPPDFDGLLPRARLYVASVFFLAPDGQATASVVGLVRAIDWLSSRDVRVIGMSLTGPPNAILRAAVEAAARQGRLVVAAVGNAGPAAAPLYPAGYPAVVAVTAVDAQKRVYRLANRGPQVDLAAPGVGIRHARAGGGLAKSSGTSMAVPFVVAALAAACEAGNCAGVLSRFQETAEDLGPPGIDPIFGHGLIRPWLATQARAAVPAP